MQHHNEEAEDEAWIYNGQEEVPPTVRRVKISEGIRRIPDEAFRLQNIEEVILSPSLQVIGKRAFYRCIKLKSILYQGQEKEDVGIPSTVKVIDDEAFSGCMLLEGIVLNERLVRMQCEAFYQCQSLTAVEIPSTVKVIDERAFDGCRLLEELVLNEGLKQIGKHAFPFCASLTEVDVPSTVKVIDNCAFQNCRRLARLGLNEGLERIGKITFEGCESLTEVNFPSTVKVIDNRAFSNCTGLVRLLLNEGLERIGEIAFRQCDSLSNVRIPQSVNTLATAAFIHCINLISIEFPEECSFSIDFSGCQSLTSLAGPESILFQGLAGPESILFEKGEDRKKFFQSSKLGSLVANEADLIHRLNHRFDNSPLNKLCYYQSYHSYENAMAQLHSLMDEDLLAATNQTDGFGMTSLHILSLSQTPNLDMLLAVMKGEVHADHIILSRDSFGSTPMDYLCLNRMPTSTEVIRTVLRTRFAQLLGLGRSWKSEMLQSIDGALAVDWSSRRREIDDIYMKLANYERQEMIAFLLELRLWKVKIDEVSSEPMLLAVDRQRCRIVSGAAVVIPHVLPFLDSN
eukprot:scaffold5114_cov67-Cylindrotheca_fusiformis.AAC.18